MLADSLRKSLLQSAIEGKLTQRGPGVGARDFLAEIQKEKTRLVNGGKMRHSTLSRLMKIKEIVSA